MKWVFVARQPNGQKDREREKTMNPQEPKSELLSKRQIRVFISSTFRDMQRERELLVKTVFPELRRICDERFVSFTQGH